MAIAQAVCNSFKQEILEGIHDFESGGDEFKLALYDDTANLSAATTAYPGDSTGGQVGDSGEYSQGGGVLQSQQVGLDTGVAIVDFDDLSFTGVTLTARGALIYNTSESNKAVCVLDFGAVKTITSETLTVTLPDNTATTALIRFE